MTKKLLDASSILIMFQNNSKALRDVKEFRVLPLTIFEIGNAIRTEAYVRRTSTPENAAASLDGITRIVGRMGVEPVDDPVGVLTLAGRYGLSFYDASYLWAATVGGYTLVTDDRKLAHEASSEGVDVLGADTIS
jgi:predicted nucleic acid-binding protein